MSGSTTLDDWVVPPAAPAAVDDWVVPPPGRTGYGANIAAGVVHGAEGVANVASDPFGNLIGKPIATLGMFAHDALAPVFGYDRFSPEFRNAMLDDTVPQPGTRLVQAADAANKATGGASINDVRPGTPGEAFVASAVPAAIGMAALGGGAGAARNIIINPLLGVAGEAGGQAAASAVPEWAAPAAALGGNMAAMTIPHAAVEGVGGLFSKPNALLDEAGAPVISRATGAPLMATPKQVAAAAEGNRTAATDPAAIRAVLDNPAPPVIPGDNPTTAKLTQDPGLASAEFTASRTGTDPQKGAFIEQANKQNDARVAVLKGLEPAGAPEAVPAALQRQAANADALSAAQVAGVQTRAAGDISAVGAAGQERIAREQAAVEAARTQREAESQGRLTALSETAEQAKVRADAEANGRLGGLQETAEQTRARMGGDLPPGSEVQVGAAVRAPVKAFDDAMKARENAAWAAIDPNGTLAIDMTPVRAGAKQILADRSPLAEPLAGKEKGIFDTAEGLADVHSFKDLSALRSRLTDAIRQERASPTGDSQAVRRMSMLLDDVHTAMEGGLTGNAAADNAAVQAGTMSPEQTAFSRYAAQRDAWYAEQANAARVNQAASVAAGSAGRDASTRPMGISPMAGGEVSSRGRSGGPAGNQSLSGSAPLTANFDQAAQDRYAAARAATAVRKSGFEDAPGIKTILQSGPTAGTFRVPDAMVPAAVIRTGPAGADHVRVYLAKGGSPEALTDAAAFSLRRDAMRPDGTLDPAKAASWADKRSSFLAALPDAATKFGDAVTAQRNLELAQAAETQAAKVRALTDAASMKTATTAESQAMKAAGTAEAARLKAVTTEAAQTLKEVTAIAQRTVDDAMAARATVIKDRQSSVIGKFLGDADPVARVWSILNDKATGRAQMSQLVEAVRGNPDATAGLQRAVAEAIDREVVGNSRGPVSAEGALRAEKFQNLITHGEPTLREVMTPEQMRGIMAANETLKRDYRSGQVGVGSATGQIQAGTTRGVIRQVAGVMAAGITGASVGATIGSWISNHIGLGAYPGIAVGSTIGTAVAGVIRAAREAGIQNVADLRTESLLNPALYRLLDTKLTTANESALLAGIAKQLGRASLVGGTTQNNEGPKELQLEGPQNALLH